MKDEHDIEDERQQMFNNAMEIIHNCIWAEDDDGVEECDKGLLIHIRDRGETRSVRVFKFNMDDNEALGMLKVVAVSAIEKDQNVGRYN